MTKNIFILLTFLFFSFSPLFAIKIQEGYWKGDFIIQEIYTVPIVFSYSEKEGLTLINDVENIPMKTPIYEGDRVEIQFIDFLNYIEITEANPKELKGAFVYPNRTENTHVYFTAHYIGDEMLLGIKSNPIPFDISGDWKATFRAKGPKPYNALGRFKQKGIQVSGTFMSNSGDYGVITGVSNNGRVQLYSVDGSGIALYYANFKNDSLVGTYFSGNHYSTDWVAVRDAHFTLSSPDSLTFKTSEEVSFQFLTLEGEEFTFPNPTLKDKVVIFQIMGTWCPNCVDESKYFSQLYEKYNAKGLEIIGVAYEYPKTFEEQASRVLRLKNNIQIPYPIVIGGELSSKKVLKDFYMLNTISAYPTTIFIDKTGKIVKVHTGFNGPGTFEVFEEYKMKTEAFIEELLQ